MKYEEDGSEESKEGSQTDKQTCPALCCSNTNQWEEEWRDDSDAEKRERDKQDIISFLFFVQFNMFDMLLDTLKR